MHGLFLTAALLLAAADPAPAPQPPADFRMVLGLYGPRKDPINTADLVVRRGVAYQFLTQLKEEVQIIDPANKRVVLLDLRRRVQTEIPFAQLESGVERVRKSIAGVAERKEKSESRSDRLEGAMSRDLVEPRLKVEVVDAAAGTFRLTNPTVEIDATTERDDDAARVAFLRDCLVALARLGSLRDPTSLPPFPRIESIDEVMGRRKLRLAELSTLYRLSGPPRRLRWTYRLVPGLTQREVEAIARVDDLRTKARFIPLARYEVPAEEP